MVLTAAHCVYRDKGWISFKRSAVYLGGVDKRSMKPYKIASISIPNAWVRDGSQYGDIAIVALNRAAVGVRPATLPPPGGAADLTGIKYLMAVGWGATEGYTLPDVARFTTLTLRTRAQCRRILAAEFGTALEEDHICFGMDRRPAVAVCNGDSGGPLIAATAGGPVVVALTSYGPDVCGERPSVNAGTDLGYWRQEVENVISFNNLRGSRAPARLNENTSGRCYRGTELGTARAPPYRCLEKCRAAPACTAWTQNITTSRCTLFSSVKSSYTSQTCFSGVFK